MDTAKHAFGFGVVIVASVLMALTINRWIAKAGRTGELRSISNAA